MSISPFTSARLVYPHQLFEAHFSADKSVLFILIEDDLFFRQFKFHKQKLILHRASMQHFKTSLEQKGFTVDYIETSAETHSMDTLEQTLRSRNISEISHFELVDDWLERRLATVVTSLSCEVHRLNSPGFLTTRGQIDEYFDTHPNRMQTFYEWQRKRLDILVKNNKPTGGKWSFDQANRKKLPKNIQLAPAYPYESPALVDDATKWVDEQFPNNPGVATSFQYPISRTSAQLWLKHFISERLEQFGPYEDAISTTESELFHSLLSPLLNIGLLTPQEVVEAALATPRDAIPIESLEGFIRQIIGWREYMRATYVRFGSRMRTSNHLNFTTTLPKSWWNGTVGIDPIDTTIKRVLDTGYAHHIERLMILGNSMVLLRIHPDDVYEWFMSLFIDAYDWVMVPNVYAMSQFAAGELITTKPYISGSNYIIKMSDYKKGEWSEVWDALYWQFISDYRPVIERNYRSAMVVKLYDKFANDKKSSIQKTASNWVA